MKCMVDNLELRSKTVTQLKYYTKKKYGDGDSKMKEQFCNSVFSGIWRNES